MFVGNTVSYIKRISQLSGPWGLLDLEHTNPSLCSTSSIKKADCFALLEDVQMIWVALSPPR